jgi:hypothetical protein
MGLLANGALASSFLALFSFAFADVMPHCGGPKVEVRNPGEDCGAHGPRWRGDCRAPAACFDVDTGGSRCTIACAQDSDCATLGTGFTCSGRGSPYVTSEPKRAVCSRAQKSE